MQTTNPVYNVLVTVGNQAILAAGNRPDDLNNGQLGAFNYQTGLSVDDSSDLQDLQEIYFAVGINRTTGGTDDAEDIRRSLGQMIQLEGVRALTLKGYMIEVAQVVDVTNFSAKCLTYYGIKVEFRSDRIYGLNGFNGFTKTYDFTTGCCPQVTSCDDCSTTGDPIELVDGIIANVNADDDNLVTASAFGWKIIGTINTAPTSDDDETVTVGSTVYTVPLLNADTAAQAAVKIAAQINSQTDSPYRASVSGAIITIYSTTIPTTDTDTITVLGTTGTTINTVTAATKTAVTDTAAFAAAFPDAALGIRLTANIQARTTLNGSIPVKFWTNGMNMVVSLVGDFGICNGGITQVTDAVYPDGKGADVQVLEYEAGGWTGNPGPYRTQALTGLQKGNFEYFAALTTNYNLWTLVYEQDSVSGARRYVSNIQTIFAVPCGDGTTNGDLADLFDVMFDGKFDAITDDLDNADCTNIAVHTVDDVTADGIKITS